MLLGVLPAILPQSSAHAASVYLADELGNTEINVDVDDDVTICGLCPETPIGTA